MKMPSYISIFLTITLSVWASMIEAQTNTYKPFPETSNSFWRDHSTYYDFGSPWVATITTDLFHYLTGEDTIVNQKRYHKVYAQGGQSSDFPPDYFEIEEYYEGSIRQDINNKLVYWLAADSQEEELLYDFNLELGDTIQNVQHLRGNIVVGIDSVLIGNNYHKRFLMNFNDGMPQQTDTAYALIEGVGSTRGLRYYMHPDFEGGTRLICFKGRGDVYSTLGSACEFTAGISEQTIDQQLLLFPNPITNESTVSCGPTFKHCAVFNTLYQQIPTSYHFDGKELTIFKGDLPAGLYYLKISLGTKIQVLRFSVAD